MDLDARYFASETTVAGLDALESVDFTDAPVGHYSADHVLIEQTVCDSDGKLVKPLTIAAGHYLVLGVPTDG